MQRHEMRASKHLPYFSFVRPPSLSPHDGLLERQSLLVAAHAALFFVTPATALPRVSHTMQRPEDADAPGCGGGSIPNYFYSAHLPTGYTHLHGELPRILCGAARPNLQLVSGSCSVALPCSRIFLLWPRLQCCLMHWAGQCELLGCAPSALLAVIAHTSCASVSKQAMYCCGLPVSWARQTALGQRSKPLRTTHTATL